MNKILFLLLLVPMAVFGQYTGNVPTEPTAPSGSIKVISETHPEDTVSVVTLTTSGSVTTTGTTWLYPGGGSITSYGAVTLGTGSGVAVTVPANGVYSGKLRCPVCAPGEGHNKVDTPAPTTFMQPDGDVSVDTSNILSIFSTSIDCVNCWAEADGSLSVGPAPGYRESNYYWGGRWYNEYEYKSGATDWNARCVLNYFEDSDMNRAWLISFDIPVSRLKKIGSLLEKANIRTDVYGDQINMDIPPPGYKQADGFPIGGKNFKLDDLKETLLKAILDSRK